MDLNGRLYINKELFNLILKPQKQMHHYTIYFKKDDVQLGNLFLRIIEDECILKGIFLKKEYRTQGYSDALMESYFKLCEKFGFDYAKSTKHIKPLFLHLLSSYGFEPKEKKGIKVTIYKKASLLKDVNISVEGTPSKKFISYCESNRHKIINRSDTSKFEILNTVYVGQRYRLENNDKAKKRRLVKNKDIKIIWDEKNS